MGPQGEVRGKKEKVGGNQPPSFHKMGRGEGGVQKRFRVCCKNVGRLRRRFFGRQEQSNEGTQNRFWSGTEGSKIAFSRAGEKDDQVKSK